MSSSLFPRRGYNRIQQTLKTYRYVHKPVRHVGVQYVTVMHHLAFPLILKHTARSLEGIPNQTKLCPSMTLHNIQYQCSNTCTHTHTHTYIYVYVYIYIRGFIKRRAIAEHFRCGNTLPILIEQGKLIQIAVLIFKHVEPIQL